MQKQVMQIAAERIAQFFAEQDPADLPQDPHAALEAYICWEAVSREMQGCDDLGPSNN